VGRDGNDVESSDPTRVCQCISRGCLNTAPSNRTLVDCSTGKCVSKLFQSCSILNSVCQSCRILQGNLIVLEPDPVSPAVVAIRDFQEEAFVHAYKDESTFQKMVSGAIFDELLLNRTADLIEDIIDFDTEPNDIPIDVDAEPDDIPIDAKYNAQVAPERSGSESALDSTLPTADETEIESALSSELYHKDRRR
jgi:hypothetical protein